jgi:hypothetical protein
VAVFAAVGLAVGVSVGFGTGVSAGGMVLVAASVAVGGSDVLVGCNCVAVGGT